MPCIAVVMVLLAAVPTVAYCEPYHIRSSAGRDGSETEDAFHHPAQKLSLAAATEGWSAVVARVAASWPGSCALPWSRLSTNVIITQTVAPGCIVCIVVAVDKVSALTILGAVDEFPSTILAAIAVQGLTNPVTFGWL